MTKVTRGCKVLWNSRLALLLHARCRQCEDDCSAPSFKFALPQAPGHEELSIAVLSWFLDSLAKFDPELPRTTKPSLWNRCRRRSACNIILSVSDMQTSKHAGYTLANFATHCHCHHTFTHFAVLANAVVRYAWAGACTFAAVN